MYHKYTPLLGTYKSDDSFVMSKHIDWATGYGINTFLVSWTGYESGDLKYFDDNLKLLFDNELSSNIFIGILYESYGRLKSEPPPRYISLDDPQNIEKLMDDFNYLAKNYFHRNNYLRLDGKPAIYLYESKGFTGDVEGVIRELRDTIKKQHNLKLFLISDHAHPLADINNQEWIERALQFDGLTSWLGGYSPSGEYVGGSYENQLNINYKKWGSWCRQNNKSLIPFGTPEFDYRFLPYGNPTSIPIERSAERSKTVLRILLENGKRILYGTFNDFFECSCVEPSDKYKFTELGIIKNKLTSDNL